MPDIEQVDQVDEKLTKTGFPANDPQVFELYWSPPQVKARGHPNMITAQKFLLNLWHSSDPNSPISLSQPVVYADRVRIRQPGDAEFALGPHADGGSVERWEPNGYGVNGVYDSVFQGRWEEFNPFESSSRVPAVSDLYHGGGSCSMFRMFQAWLGMSHTAPGEGTLKVNPLIQLTTAYFLLRPFFEPIKDLPEGKEDQYTEEYLSPENWRLIPSDRMTTALHGATPSHGQEMTEKLHPHLDLKNTMVHVPTIRPGDYVAWHCDSKFTFFFSSVIFPPTERLTNPPQQQFTPSIKLTAAKPTVPSSTSPLVPSPLSTLKPSPASAVPSSPVSQAQTSQVAKVSLNTSVDQASRNSKNGLEWKA